MSDEIAYMSATELAAAYRDRSLSPVEVVDSLLERIDNVDPHVHAFITVADDYARAAARVAEQEFMSTPVEELGRLCGVPVTVKDLTPTAGVRTTFGLVEELGNIPTQDGLTWARLKAEGAVLLGKTSTPPLGSLCVTENDIVGRTNNPWDLSRTCGGSSDTIAGGAGNDIIRYTVVGTSGDGIDTVDGGADFDTLILTGQGSTNEFLDVTYNGTSLTLVELGAVTDVEAVTANMLGGVDSLTYTSPTAAVSVDLTTGLASGFTSIAGIENVTGGAAGDTIRASGAVNVLAGNGGDDTIIATVDNVADTFAGNAGNNTLDYSAYATALTVTLVAAGSTTVGGSGAALDIISGFANFIGAARYFHAAPATACRGLY